MTYTKQKLEEMMKRNGHTAFDTYNRVEEIHAILHEEKGNEIES